ncbi:MAG: hypothetical protein KGJ70_07180 [Gemmatimonadota bacterium]|nr:hypothetical protein [Gemmatimonadota bacterium]
MKLHLALPALLLAAAPASAQAPATGQQLLAAMHDRYAATWYRTLTFVQRSAWYAADGSEARVQTWYEAMSAPGKLRIDMGDGPTRHGAIFRGDSTYSFAADTLVRAAAERNLLLVLGFDVYTQPVAHTARVLSEEGIDLSRMHRAEFEGRPVYVVGALAGDSASKQFWVDAARLLFVRLIAPHRAAAAAQDIRFDKYVERSGGWLAEQVRVLAGGRLVYEEDYRDVRVNLTLDPRLWDPASWASVPAWWKR